MCGGSIGDLMGLVLVTRTPAGLSDSDGYCGPGI